MIDLVFRYDPNAPPVPLPETPDEARQRLVEGNRWFAETLMGDVDSKEHRVQIVPIDLRGMGVETSGVAPRQQPFAVVLGCADARVPIELVFGQGCNDMFVVRVAGNVRGSECIGSIDYALENFHRSVRLVVVLGHSGCGAVSAAVDAFLNPSRYLAVAPTHPLRSILDHLFVPIRAAAQSLETAWGPTITKHTSYREVLIDMSVVLNAALTAKVLKRESVGVTNDTVQVVYGYYDLACRKVELPTEVMEPGHQEREVTLADPPSDLEGFKKLGMRLANGKEVNEAFVGANA